MQGMTPDLEERVPGSAERAEQHRAIGRYVETYSLVVQALRWRVQAMLPAPKDMTAVVVADLGPRPLVEAFVTLTRHYADDLRTNSLLAALSDELLRAIDARDAIGNGDWLVGYAWIDPDLKVEARIEPALRYRTAAELDAASVELEAVERVLRMWVHLVSPLTGELGQSPFFKIDHGRVRC
jgi:hypothetical protein